MDRLRSEHASIYGHTLKLARVRGKVRCVCRYWRQSITSDPTNWAVMSNLSNDLTALSLERVGAALLDVSLVARKRAAPCYLPTSYIQNIVSLRVGRSTTVDTLREAFPGFPRSMPNLQSLEFSSVHGAEWDLSVDPFESLTSTIRRVYFTAVPLYPSILRLRSLTELTYLNLKFDLHLDTLLDFLEESPSLESVTLAVYFREASFRSSRRGTPIQNRLRYLAIRYRDVMDGRALISSIALGRGACLNILHGTAGTGLNDMLSGVSTAHLSNLCSPTFMEYRSFARVIQLLGPNGRFSFKAFFVRDSEAVFTEFPLLPLANIREVHLMHRTPKDISQNAVHPQVFPSSGFPALETLTVDCETGVLQLLSALFSNPSCTPLLKTLAFLNCNLGEEFMEELMHYASKRKETTSAWLHRVVIVNPDGVFPKIDSIRKLCEYVPIIDVKVGMELPKDLIR